MSTDYKASLHLPKTDFPMKAGLPKREPEFLERWAKMGLGDRLRADAKSREKFILHDGPPYANGNIHIGTALNKILKDVINRSQQMMGKDARYVPGWDCHGLPIEWKIEEKYRAAGKDKDDVPIIDFRRECREFAEHWIDVQREEFKRLGVEGDWDHPYTTMSYAAEAQIVRELLKFLMDGSLYKGAKAVMWSVVEQTSLAEAEIEYHDHTSTTIYVRFPVVKADDPALQDASVVIWTTTPWTIPGNRALAYHTDIKYGVYRVDSVGEGSLAQAGEKLALADDLAEEVRTAAGIEAWTRLSDVKTLGGTVCRHPFHGQGYDFDVPMLDADYVTTEQGSGFVHIAPGHGAEDFELGLENGIEVPQTVDEDGTYFDHVPLFAGKHVFKVDRDMVEALTGAGALVAHGKLVHSYPHSWRSKAPLIFRNAPQWFISMSETGIRDKALKAIKETAFYPKSGQNRLYDMIENRPDWLVSRQRAWGVPITVFVHKQTGEPLRDPAVNERIVQAVEAESCDAWFESDAARFLGNDYNPADYDKVSDILDVWFDSGSTHAFVLEPDPEMRWPASLYLEGSDQHRGWFHSSMLEACGTRGRAPYEAVLTHGFVMDGEGRKMSKSLGNTVAPQDVIKQNGAEILRLWVVSADYSEDLRIGPEIVRAQVDAYRRMRNTLRFMLGNLSGWNEAERLPHAEMPELERWVLHRLSELDELVRESCNGYDFHRIYVALYNFCTVDLSALYFDIRKDALYCDPVDSVRRRAARTVLDELFSCLTAWLAPILCFTAEEAWLSRFPSDDASVHLRQFPTLPAEWRDPVLAEKWAKLRALRRAVTGALEIERREKRIGSSLQASPTVYTTEDFKNAADGVDLAEICITSGAELVVGDAPADAFTLDEVAGVAVVPGQAEGKKCQRCWMVLPEVGSVAGHDDLCQRCADAVG
ncbi:MAG: isoleucine--tRNA ligase [Minwuiales bacterium]|nr:isoleucine--tRNA ligase [Minwuiales bacterium]